MASEPGNLPAEEGLVNVRGTELRSDDPRERYRQKLARITLDSMVQFVGLLDARGTVIEINKVALDAVGIRLADVEGRPFWNTFWWQVSEEINATLREMIARAAQGEFVRWDTEIFGRAGGKETIIIDASLMPVKDDDGKVVFIAAEGRDITEKKAYEREIARQREELAKLDVLKTQFFANISHEFRTPLTLILGPLEDTLGNVHGVLPPAAVESLATSHRNAMRLLKLVNALLDFSRIEAGRIQASYEPTDLSALTADLANNFRSLCEKAGLRLIVDCQGPSGELAYVDRDMWEKIVLNLLSNAFKFTLKGEIEVRLDTVDDTVDGHARLTVRDTGVGIPSDELPRMFERFHRIEQTRGRTHEGTGIGLALVQELVKLHGGTVSVDSVAGEGSTFTVVIPFGTAHLDPERIGKVSGLASTSVTPSAFTEEALGWLPDEAGNHNPVSVADELHAPEPVDDEPVETGKPRILWADDNADMRVYVVRLLSGRFDVQAVPDGEAALSAARAHPPDLILSDVMMPKLDGFGLLRALRADPELREIPVILLSARAGEDSRIEGIEVGADDYLVKPFSARELIARVETHVKIFRIRKEASAALRVSEERFKTLANAAPAILWITEPDASCSFFSRGWYDFTGQSENAALGFGWLDAVHPDDRGQSRAMIAEAHRRHEAFSLDYRLRRADGEYRWVMNTGVLRFNPEGRFAGYIGSVIDIHERKEVAQSSALLSAIVDSSDDAIISKGLDGVITSWNQSAGRLFGYTAEEAIGQTVAALLIPDDRQQEEPEILSRLREGERVDHFETVRRRKDGSLVDISLTVSPVKDQHGRIIGASKVARDITQRKMYEQRLVEQAHLLDVTGDAILVRDEQDRILYWNRAAEKMYGFTREEALGQNSHDLLRTEFPEPLPGILEMLSRNGHWSGELKHVRRDGSQLVTLSRWVAERDEKNAIRVLESNNDITERVRVQEEVRRANQDLEQFAFSASHDLQEPLRSIKIYSELLGREFGGKLNADAQKYMQFLSSGATRMEALVRDLLAYTRAGKFEEPTAPVDANEALQAALLALSGAITEARAHVTSDPLPTVRVHETHLQQLFQNLVGNSIKYRSPERVPQVHIGAKRQNGQWVFAVSDNGIGIEPEYKENIFGLFKRLHTSEEYSGTGIGLAICQRIVERYHGRIWVESEPGRGSTFRFTLPI